MTHRRIAILTLIVLLTVACGADTTVAPDTTVVPPEIDLRIGVVAPLTGNLSSIGPGQAEASRVAVEVIEEALANLGLDESISVDLVGVEDSQGDTVPAVEAATKLATTGIDVLVGSCATRETIAIAQSVTVRNKILQISMCSSAPELSDLDDEGLVWQMIYPNTLLAAAFVKAAQDALGPTATISTGSINDAGNGAARVAFDEAWQAAGGAIGESVAWNLEQPTYDTEAQRLVSGDPDGWVIYTTPEDWNKLGPALVRTGTWSPANTIVIEVFRDSSLLEELGDPSTAGLRGVSPTNEGSPGKEAFEAIFEQRATTELTGFDALGFDPVILAFLAALHSGSDDPLTFRDSMASVSGPPGIKVGPDEVQLAIELLLSGENIDYDGGWGSIDWDEKGDPASSLFEFWQYPGGGEPIPPGDVVVVTLDG